jgi:uncharacterized protein (DUF362 family)
MPPKVAISKGTTPYEMLKEAFKFFDDFKGKITGKKVIIKPNFGAWNPILPKTANEMVVTSKNVLMATITLLQELGASSITIAESAFIGNDMDKIYKDMGLVKELAQKNVQLVNIAKDTFQKVELFDGISIEISDTVLKAECLINMPLMKTHGITTVTLGLKNLKGALSDKSKRTFHREGLTQTIAHLGSIIKPTINIVDGLIGLEGFGPVQTGTPINVGVIIVSDNLVATDAVAASVMGFNPAEISHLKLAAELENIDFNSIEVIGASINSVKKPFKPCPMGAAVYAHASELIGFPTDAVTGNYTDHWCSMCMMNFMGTVWALRDDAGTNPKQKLFVVSDQADLPKDYEGQLVLFGNCQARNRAKVGNDNYIFIEGCPPSQMKVYTTFGKILFPRGRFIWGLLKRLFKGSKLSWLPQWKEKPPSQ